jgi:hypothetical protein
MKTFKEFITEAHKLVPDKPGTVPIPDGHVRLYHQTSEENLRSIRRNGIQLSKAKGYEGPKAIYADEHGFYGEPHEVPTVEFHVPKESFSRPFVKMDVVPPENIIAVHRPWHETARYIEDDKEIRDAVLRGEHDDLKSDQKYGKAIRYIKKKYGSA